MVDVPAFKALNVIVVLTLEPPEPVKYNFTAASAARCATASFILQNATVIGKISTDGTDVCLAKLYRHGDGIANFTAFGTDGYAGGIRRCLWDEAPGQ